LRIEELREMIKLIDESSIHEFTYENNESKVILKKNTNNHTSLSHQNMKQEISIPKEQIKAVEEQSNNVEKQTNESNINYDYEIVSPMVGTLYSAPSPESEPYVAIGSRVTKDSIVCIVEAMKLFNEIEAEVTGEIVEILVENGELVEYGQPLFRVKTI